MAQKAHAWQGQGHSLSSVKVSEISFCTVYAAHKYAQKFDPDAIARFCSSIGRLTHKCKE